MKIAQRKQVLLVSLRPDRLVETATAGTVAIATGVIGVVLVFAPVALDEMPAKATGATPEDVSRDLALLGREFQGGHVIAQHVGNTGGGALAAGHDQFASGVGFRVSSGLFTSPSQVLAKRT